MKHHKNELCRPFPVPMNCRRTFDGFFTQPVVAPPHFSARHKREKYFGYLTNVNMYVIH